ncbi:hypothetical protein BSM4216_1781 [Bacillus smithii]|jgi:hypothetical protein|nr:hypothetical protein BSM4216_1781 [Bacillus smithii]
MKADELDLTQIYKISTLHNQDDPQERMVTNSRHRDAAP